MSKSIDEILTTIRNLIARAKDSATTPDEAASAMAHVQRLMEKHRIEEAQLAQGVDERAPVIGHGRVADTGNDTLPAWVWRVFWTLCYVNNCTGYQSHGVVERDGKVVKRVFLCAVGTEYDRAVVGYMFEYIRTQIMRLALEGARKAGTSSSPKWLNAFRVGAADTVAERINLQRADIRREERKLAEGRGTDLAIVDKREELTRDLIKQYEREQMRFTTKTYRATNTNGTTAHDLGREAGHSVDITAKHGGKQLE